MTMAGVIKYPCFISSADARHHIRHHRAQACPGNHMFSIDRGKIPSTPINERLNTIIPNIFIDAVKFSRPRDAKTIRPKPTGHYLGFIIQQTYPRSSPPAFLIVQRHRDGITFDRINIYPITKLRCDSAAPHPGTNHYAVKTLCIGICC